MFVIFTYLRENVFSGSCCGHGAMGARFITGTDGSESPLYFTLPFSASLPLSVPSPASLLSPLAAFSFFSASLFTFPFTLRSLFLLFDFSVAITSPLLFFQLTSLLLLSFLVSRVNLNSRKHTVLDLGSRLGVLLTSFEHVPVIFLTFIFS